MNGNLSEIICIIDRSGSMESIKSDAIGGFNSFISEQKKGPGEANVTLVLFDDQYDIIAAGTPLDQIVPLNEDTFVPRASTALFDAIGKTLVDVGARLAATPESKRPGNVIVAILTDGEENASHVYSREKIAAMIQHQRDVYSWEFIFLAANQDAVATASQISIDAASAVPFAASAEGTRAAFSEMSQRSMISRHQAIEARREWEQQQAEKAKAKRS
jgi:hypothetical protein